MKANFKGTFKDYVNLLETMCLKHIMNSPLTEALYSEIEEAVDIVFKGVGITLTHNQLTKKVRYYFDKANYLLSMQEAVKHIPLNEDDDTISREFMHFPEGTDIEEVWCYLDSIIPC